MKAASFFVILAALLCSASAASLRGRASRELAFSDNVQDAILAGVAAAAALAARWEMIPAGQPGTAPACYGNTEAGAGYVNELGSKCIYDAAHCEPKYRQCGIPEDTAAAVCAEWDDCAGVVCRPGYGGYCLARKVWDDERVAFADMWAYKLLDAACEQDEQLAPYHESFDKLEGTFANDLERWDAASAACAARGQYICSSAQNAEQCSVAQEYPSATFLAVGDDSAKAWIDVGPNGSSNLVASPFVFIAAGEHLPGATPADRLFSCCGTHYPGNVNQQTTTLIAINVADEGDAAELVFVSEPRLLELVNSIDASAGVEAEAEAGTSTGCTWETDGDGESSFFCGAEAEAAVRATIRAEASTTVATVGGVPVVGTVYFEATAGASASATAGITDEGLEVSAGASFDISGTVGVEFTGEVAPGTEVSGGLSATAGVEGEASATATVTLSEVSADADASVTFGVAVEASGGVEADEGSAEGTVGTCAGCVGGGVAASVGFSGCTATVGTEANVALGVGLTVGFEAEANFCSLGGAIAKSAVAVASWGDDLANDVANGVTDAAAAVAAVTVDAANIVASGTTEAANAVADWTVGAGNTIADGTKDALDTVEDTAEDVGSEIASWFGRR